MGCDESPIERVRTTGLQLNGTARPAAAPTLLIVIDQTQRPSITSEPTARLIFEGTLE